MAKPSNVQVKASSVKVPGSRVGYKRKSNARIDQKLAQLIRRAGFKVVEGVQVAKHAFKTKEEREAAALVAASIQKAETAKEEAKARKETKATKTAKAPTKPRAPRKPKANKVTKAV
ncbi:hypothetical protein TH2_117 [Shewanella phage Thanatos-2]|nr:hypothetical protein TH2_117 [Shewanella phage Thanatos-2]